MRTVIMGGTAGIGRATAELLAGAGHEVIVTGRDPERLAQVGRVVAAAHAVDTTDRAQTEAFLAEVGSFDHLVLAFSQGAGAFGPLAQLSETAIRDAFDGKLIAYLHALQHAQVTGSVTLVAAASARGAMPGTVVLAAANGGIERMVPPLAAELAPVRVNAVSPGVVDTNWWSFLDDAAKQEQFEQIAAGLPIKRVGRPDDVARAIRYAIEAEYVTGTVLPVDGGITLG